MKRIDDKANSQIHTEVKNVLISTGVIGKVPFRLGDVVARYGGEEFAVILPNTDDRKGIVAERCRRAVERMQIRHVSSDIAHVVTVSVGESTQWPHREGDPLQLLSEADDALYRAKDAGRNRIEVAKAEPALVTDGGQASTPLQEY